jgi:hypothetical protein
MYSVLPALFTRIVPSPGTDRVETVTVELVDFDPPVAARVTAVAIRAIAATEVTATAVLALVPIGKQTSW